MPAATPAVLSYEGATTIGLHLLPDLAPLLVRHGLRLGSIGERGSNPGLQAARDGQADVAGVLRELSGPEKAELRWALIGHDALGIFVSEENPLRSLTRAQLKAIFQGAVRDWAEVGGAAGPVVPVTEFQAGGRGTVQELRRLALGGEPFGPTREYDDAPDCLRHVAGDRGAVTAASMSMAIPGVRAVAIDGVAPTAASVRTGTYPLGRPMYLVARAPGAAAVEAFLGVVLSPEGQAVVGRRFTPAL